MAICQAAGHRTAPGYVPALDGLRALAALAVVGFHLRLPGFGSGWLGVDVFFVLSGVLITGLLLRELAERDTLSFRRFYRGRALRLLPAYLLVVIVCLVVDRVVHAGATLRGAVYSFLYVANWALVDGQALGSLHHTWSLSIEEQFYLLWPLLLLGLWRVSRRRHLDLRLVVGAVAALAALGCVAAVGAGVSMVAFVNGSPFRAAELLVGALLACVLAHRRPAPAGPAPRRTALVGAGGLVGLTILALLVALARVVTPADEACIWLLVAVGTVLVVIACLRPTVVARLLSVRPLVLVGRMSYGLYLWHFPVLTTIDARWGLDHTGAKLAGLGVTALLVPLSYYGVEQPFQRLRRRRDAVDQRVAVASASSDPIAAVTRSVAS